MTRRYEDWTYDDRNRAGTQASLDSAGYGDRDLLMLPEKDKVAELWHSRLREQGLVYGSAEYNEASRPIQHEVAKIYKFQQVQKVLEANPECHVVYFGDTRGTPPYGIDSEVAKMLVEHYGGRVHCYIRFSQKRDRLKEGEDWQNLLTARKQQLAEESGDAIRVFEHYSEVPNYEQVRSAAFG